MDLFDFFSMAGEIAEFFKAAGQDIGNLFKKKNKIKQSHFANREKESGWTADELSKAREPWDFMPIEYWQDLLKEKLKEKEQIDKKIIEDYGRKHASEKTDEQEPEQTNDKESSEPDDSINSDENLEAESDAFESDGSFESGFDTDSDGSSSGNDGYID